MGTARSTIFKGIAKSRCGSPAISLQTVIDRSMRKEADSVSNDEALAAARVLSKKRSPLRHLDTGAVSGAIAPLAQALGRGTEALIDAKKGRWGAAGRAARATTRGGIAKNVATGTLFGAGMSAAGEGLRVSRAKDTYEDFLKQHTRKNAGLLTLLSRLRNQGFDPIRDQEEDVLERARRYGEDALKPIKAEKEKAATAAFIDMAKLAFGGVAKPPKPAGSISARAGGKASQTGRFTGVQTQNSLKPPGPSVSQIAVNPRRSISQAINAFRS